MKKNIITLKNEEMWIFEPIRSNCENIIQFESEVNDQLELLYINIPEDRFIEFDKKINAPNLRGVMISGGGSKNFIRDFNTYFKEIPDLDAVSFRRTGIEEIPDFVLQSPHLESLGFRYDNIKELPSELFKLKNLEHLSFEYNWKLKCVPDEICKLSLLKAFILWDAKLNYLSPELFNLPDINLISLTYCRYSASQETREALQNWLNRKEKPDFTSWLEPDEL